MRHIANHKMLRTYILPTRVHTRRKALRMSAAPRLQTEHHQLPQAASAFLRRISAMRHTSGLTAADPHCSVRCFSFPLQCILQGLLFRREAVRERGEQAIRRQDTAFLLRVWIEANMQRCFVSAVQVLSDIRQASSVSCRTVSVPLQQPFCTSLFLCLLLLFLLQAFRGCAHF